MACRVNTAIRAQNYQARGMFVHNLQTGTCKRSTDGKLWATCSRTNYGIHLVKSEDNGFSWEQVGLNVMGSGESVDRAADGERDAGEVVGPIHFLEVLPQANKIYIPHWNGTTDLIEYAVYDFDDGTATRGLEVSKAASEPLGLAFTSCANNERIYIVFVSAAGSDLTVRWIDVETGFVDEALVADLPKESTYNYLPRFSCCVDEDGVLHVICATADSLGGNKDQLYYVQGKVGDNDADGEVAWGTPVLIHSCAGVNTHYSQVKVALDSYGTLLVMMGFTIGANQIYYTSTDSGANWSAATTFIATTNGYTDPITSEVCSYFDAIGGTPDGGFLMAYIRDNASEVPRAYVRPITTSDGSTYTLGTEVEATGIAAALEIHGIKLFAAEATLLQDLNKPEHVRIAYQVGVGNSKWGEDRKPVAYEQEPLGDTAYPSSTLLSPPSENVDLYGWDIEDDTVGQWLLNDDAATTAVADALGTYAGVASANTSVLSSAGKLGASFDLAGAYSVSFGDEEAFHFNNGTNDLPLSLAGWAYVSAAAAAQVIMSKATSATDFEWEVGINADEKLYLKIYDNTNATFITVTSDTAFTASDWTHFAVTYDGRGGPNAHLGIRLYLDAEIVEVTNTTSTTYQSMQKTEAVMLLGAHYSTLAAYWEGKLDTISLHNKELSYKEVEKLYNDDTGTVSLDDGNRDTYDPFIGDITTKYETAINKLGVELSVQEYVPDADAEMGDKSGYGDPVNHRVSVVVDPQSYGFPIPDVVESAHTDWVEQDIRKVFLPPSFHLARTFVVNKGNNLKRTVWTIFVSGNEYEISQVVPRFINGQLAYYEANLYVVGPSRDPWARTILLSET